MGTRDLYTTNPQLLSKLLGLDTLAQHTWQVDDLAAMLRHQLQAPLEFDLITVDTEIESKLARLRKIERAPFKSFGELLYQAHPPIELLKLTKDFGKAHRNDPQSPLPNEVATVLYFAAIIVALTRCGQRITRLDNSSLRRGVEWVIAQTWVDETTRSLFRDRLSLIESNEKKTS